MATRAAVRKSGSDLDPLFDLAQQAAVNAYAPYSRFRVGAAVFTATGKIHVGCNMENIAYPLGICAEAAALAAARASEGSSLKVLEIAIYAEQDGVGQAPCAPCGGCRQRILEFGPDIRVRFMGGSNREEAASAAELLPYAFSFEPK